MNVFNSGQLNSIQYKWLFSIQLNSIQLFSYVFSKQSILVSWVGYHCSYYPYVYLKVSVKKKKNNNNNYKHNRILIFILFSKQPIPDSWVGEHRGYCSSHICGVYCIGKGVSYPFTPLKYVPMWCPGTHDCVTWFAPSPWVSNHKGDTFLRVCVVMETHVEYLSWCYHFSQIWEQRRW